MASLAQAIHTFHGGGLSPGEFFAQVDRMLAAGQADSAQLLDTLGEEDTRRLLPPEVYAELRRRIERMLASRQHANDDATRVQESPLGRSAHLAANSATSAPTLAAGFNEPSEAGLERMKGVGDTLNGRFVLEECIGFGGMGMVYKALDLRKLEASDRKPYIAIKVLNVQFRGHPKSLIALQREAKKAQTLAHPNIVTVYDFDRDGSMVYLTMEYLAGKPLSQTLRTPGFTGLPYAEAMRIVSGIARALAYAHERGFVHCDLKPANVFVTEKGEVKVIDFGIARVFHKTEEDNEATVFDAGSLGGLTPAYASPEMIEHLEPDPRDDIYALACITYELLTGHHPFDRLSAVQARGAGMKPQRPKNMGHRQWRALKSALSFERESRMPSVARFLQEMSGDRRASLQVALIASGLAVAVLLAAGISYYIASRPASTNHAPAAASSEKVPPTPSSQTPSVQAPAVQAPPQTAAPALSADAAAPMMAGISCSALSASASASTLQVQGYVSERFGISRLKEQLSAIPGAATVKLNVQQVANDKCGVINALAPYWISNHQGKPAATIHTRTANSVLTEGDPLIVDITTPGYDSYVYVDYYVLDGSVVHMVPNPHARANQAPANYQAAIGSLGNWVVSKPFGTELIVLMVTPVPLFDSMRPEIESKSDYLPALEKQLKRVADKAGANRIAADFVQINTRARKP